MKYCKYIVFFLIILVGAISCKKDFLEVTDHRVLNRQSYVKDLGSMQSFLNGIYVVLNQHFEHGLGAAYPELVADNLKPLPLPPQNLLLHYSWAQQKDDVAGVRIDEESINMNGTWKGGYLITRACNFVIEDTDKFREEGAARADDIKGQAYALRALVYFKLVNTFAQAYGFTPDATHPGIPYITTSDISQPYNRQSVAEVYNGIVSDLQSAVELLSSNASDARYMNKAAATALLARVYLFKGDYIAAGDLAKKICEEFPLLTIESGYPNALFANSIPGKNEVLFQATPGDVYRSNFLGGYLRGDNLRFNATEDIAIILHENVGDVRYNWVENVSGQWNVTKFPQNTTGSPPLRRIPEADYYQPIIRSSEMFLIAAETYAKTGDESNARVYLDAIRRRANPYVPALTASGAALVDSIYKERRKELSFEGLRMYDLQRWKLGVHRTDALNGTVTVLPYPSNKAVAPIPLTDVRLAGIPQNLDY